MTKRLTFTLPLDTETVMELEVTTIGTIPKEGGADVYILIRRLDDVLTSKQASQYIIQRFYHETYIPGGSFCNTHSVVHQQDSDNVVIATVYQRSDT
jgi:hypothetical protein